MEVTAESADRTKRKNANLGLLYRLAHILHFFYPHRRAMSIIWARKSTNDMSRWKGSAVSRRVRRPALRRESPAQTRATIVSTLNRRATCTCRSGANRCPIHVATLFKAMCYDRPGGEIHRRRSYEPNSSGLVQAQTPALPSRQPQPILTCHPSHRRRAFTVHGRARSAREPRFSRTCCRTCFALLF